MSHTLAVEVSRDRSALQDHPQQPPGRPARPRHLHRPQQRGVRVEQGHRDHHPPRRECHRRSRPYYLRSGKTRINPSPLQF